MILDLRQDFAEKGEDPFEIDWSKMEEQEIRISMISFTEAGACLAKKIKSILESHAEDCMEEKKSSLESLPGIYVHHARSGQEEGARVKITVFIQRGKELAQPVKEWCKQAFSQSHVLIFVGAVGIAVRLIAPFLRDKFQDPAVLAVDEQGNYMIPILSGHVGGANAWAVYLARELGAVAVVTTATDLYGKFAVDVFAARNGLVMTDRVLAKEISAAVLAGEKVGFYCEGEVLGELPKELACTGENYNPSEDFQISGELPKELACTGENYNLSEDFQMPERLKRRKKGLENPGKQELKGQELETYGIKVGIHKGRKDKTLFLHPKVLVLGIGCKKGKSMDELEGFIKRKFTEWEIAWESVGAVASVEQKRQEQGLLDVCRKWNIPFYTFLPGQLAEVSGNFTESSFVMQTIGVGNVCERAAVLGAVELAKRQKAALYHQKRRLSEKSGTNPQKQTELFALKRQEPFGLPELIQQKTAENGITLALAMIDWSVEFE